MDVILYSVHCYALHWTDNRYISGNTTSVVNKLSNKVFSITVGCTGYRKTPVCDFRSVTSHLMSNDVLGRVASNIGIKDLIQTAVCIFVAFLQ